MEPGRSSLLTSAFVSMTTRSLAFGRQVLPDDDSSFVWGPVGSGLTADPAGTLARPYERFVARYGERPRPHRDDAAVFETGA